MRRPFRISPDARPETLPLPDVEELADGEYNFLVVLNSIAYLIIKGSGEIEIDEDQQRQLARVHLEEWAHIAEKDQFVVSHFNTFFSLISLLLAIHYDHTRLVKPESEASSFEEEIYLFFNELADTLANDSSPRENQEEFVTESVSDWAEQKNLDFLDSGVIQLLNSHIFAVVNAINLDVQAEVQVIQDRGVVVFHASSHPNHERAQATFNRYERQFLTQLGLTLEEVYDNLEGAENIRQARERFVWNGDLWRVKLENLRQLALDYELDGVCTESKYEFASLLNIGVSLENLERFLDHFNEIDLLMAYRHLAQNEQMSPLQIEDWFDQSNDHHFDLVAKLRKNAGFKEVKVYRDWIRQVKQRHGLTTVISPETIDFVESKELEPFTAHVRPPLGTELELSDEKKRTKLQNIERIIDVITGMPANAEWGEYSPPPCYSPETLIATYNFLYDSGLLDKFPTTQHDNVGWVQSYLFSAVNVIYLQLTGYCSLPRVSAYDPNSEVSEDVSLQLSYHNQIRYTNFEGRFESKDSTNCHPEHFAKQTMLRARLAAAQYAYELALKSKFDLEDIDPITAGSYQAFDGIIQDVSGLDSQGGASQNDDTWQGERVATMPLLTAEDIRLTGLADEYIKLATIYANFLKNMKQFLEDLDLSVSGAGFIPRKGLRAAFYQVIQAYPDVDSHYSDQSLSSLGSDHIVVKAQQLGEQVVEEVEEVHESLRIKFLKFLETYLTLKETSLSSDQHDQEYKDKKLLAFISEFMENFPMALPDISEYLSPDEKLTRASQKIEKFADRYL